MNSTPYSMKTTSRTRITCSGELTIVVSKVMFVVAMVIVLMVTSW